MWSEAILWSAASLNPFNYCVNSSQVAGGQVGFKVRSSQCVREFEFNLLASDERSDCKEVKLVVAVKDSVQR